MAGALEGIRVLDFTRIIAGPFCTQQLADLGAQVIKIESPEQGDESRGWKPPDAAGESYSYLAYNRGKLGVAIDIRMPEGRKVVRGIVEKSDVLVENFRPGVMKRFGLDYDSLKEQLPGLIYCSISAYGQESQRGGMDSVVQAESGLMSITGEPEGGPLLHGIPMVDTITGVYAASAILAAVIARTRSGMGQHMDLAMFDIALAAAGQAAQYYLTSGRNPVRYGNGATQAAPVGVYKTKSGYIRLLCVTDKMYHRLCRDVLQRPELMQDPRFLTNATRIAHKVELKQILDTAFAGETRESWMEKIHSAGVTAGEVKTMSEAIESKDAQASQMIRSYKHPTAGTIRLVSSPMHRSSIAARDLLGLTADNIDGLRKSGTIR